MVSLVDLLFHPVSELLANDGSSHIHDPLLWDTHDLLIVLREVLKAFWVAMKEAQNIRDRKCVILRHINDLDVLLFDTC